MGRINKSTLTKLEIIRVASRMFLEKGYSRTTIKSVSDELDMSTGNLTFYFPTKECLLVPIIEILLEFQRDILIKESESGVNPILAVCLEVVTMAAATEESNIARDLYLSAYASTLTLEMIRKADGERSKEIYKCYCSDWTDQQFEDAEMLVTGIENAVLITPSDAIPLDRRVKSALNAILDIYNVPADIRDELIETALTSERRYAGAKIIEQFKEFAIESNDKAFEQLLKGNK